MIAAVIIPIYRTQLTEYELISLNQLYSLLCLHPLIVVKPKSLNLAKLKEKYPLISFESFDDHFFHGRKGYNKLMLSPQFYERFLLYDYILIHQLDAYVFRDELLHWCEFGYDYVGAPWLKKRIYHYPIISNIRNIIHYYKIKRGKHSSQELYNKVGNGGFSLRKVKSHHEFLIKYKDKVQKALANENNHFFHEDVFLSMEIPEFNIPSALEALNFSFDKYPSYCFSLTNKKLPFGCHSWFHYKRKWFWKSIINF
jgi:hypothetical protein